MRSAFRLLLLIICASAVLFFQCEKEDPHVKITDNNFLNALIELGIDTDGDGQISNAEAEVVISLDVSSDSISDMTGIERFVSIDTLACDYNQLTHLNVTTLSKLVYLSCKGNLLTNLDVSNNTELVYLDCGGNEFNTVDVSNNCDLESLYCAGGQLNSIDVSNNAGLLRLWCSGTSIHELDLSKNVSLVELNCGHNIQLNELDLTNSTKLERLWCSYGGLTQLILGDKPALSMLYIHHNSISTIDISRCISLQIIYLDFNPTLGEVCVWEMPFPPEGVILYTTNDPNVYFTTECSR